jgi:hypothetical protein
MGTSRAVEGKRNLDARLHEQQLRFQQSGQTAVAFCRDEGVVLSTFYQRRARWRKQRERDLTGVSKPAARFIEAGVMQVVAPVRSLPRMHRVTEPAGAGAVTVRLELGGGVVLSVTRG